MSQPRSYSLRMPEEVRCYIEDAAKQNSRSVNAEIITRLENSIHKDTTNNTPVNVDLLEQLQIALEQRQALGNQVRSMQEQLGEAVYTITHFNQHIIPALCKSKVNRFQSTHTTHGDKERLSAFIKSFLGVWKVIFYVRKGHMNHSALTLVIYNDDYAFVADGTPLTVERPPREQEVFELLKGLDFKGLLDVAEFAVTRIDQTKDLPVEQALEELEQYETKPVRSNIYEFLSLFFPEPEKVKPDWFIDGWKELN